MERDDGYINDLVLEGLSDTIGIGGPGRPNMDLFGIPLVKICSLLLDLAGDIRNTAWNT